MKVYRVITERPGKATKEPGKHSIEIMREEFRYAAYTIEEVWDAIDWIRKDEERDLIGLFEEAPAITILPSLVEVDPAPLRAVENTYPLPAGYDI